MSNSYMPLSIAQELLQLATRLAAGDEGKGAGDPSMDTLASYEAKFHMQELCTKLMQAVHGPAMYTILLAGRAVVSRTKEQTNIICGSQSLAMRVRR
jgi:hypothetical protein